MSTLETNEQYVFYRFTEDNHNWEESSNGGSASNSDFEPEIEDYEFDEVDIPESIEDSVPGNQIAYGRNWQYIPPNNTNPSVPNPSREPSLTNKSEHIETMEDCFHLFINEEILHTIIFYTNKKAEANMPPNKKWKPVDSIEIDAFFGLLLLTGRFRESHESKHDLWEVNEAFSRRFYAATMSRDRFIDILRYMRFDDTVTRAERKSNDKLAPLRTVTDIFVQNCKDSYHATNAGCIAEQLVTFRGRCSFKVCMPSKPGKYGLKIWTLCDSKTFYCCNMEVYLGKHGNVPEKQQGQSVVKQLANIWKNSGRCITTDNFFTDLTFAEDLLQNKLFMVGTVHKDKRDLPKAFTQTQNRPQYSSEFLFTEKLTLVSYVPKPRKSVIVFSTLHHERNTLAATEKFKPDIIHYYNSTKSGVDVLEKVVREYSCRRCTRRWPLSLFMHYLDIAAYNAFVIWLTKYPTWESKNSIKTRRKIFLQELGMRLTAKNIDRRATAFEDQEVGLHKNVISAIEATGRKIVKKPRTAGQKRARCCFCIGNNNRYSNVCDYCDRHVCNNHSTQNHTVLCNTCNNRDAQ
ncbi:piggyBac transposable element-derived protein 4 isoform X1 [Andrena cerasifolii]|uniref:piggyBac transposable element-derived protein 4 isoform X1 n=1 Tax=Andrena cerasifolii TaxID=2819439 RepID=UPI0040383EAB